MLAFLRQLYDLIKQKSPAEAKTKPKESIAKDPVKVAYAMASGHHAAQKIEDVYDKHAVGPDE